MNRFTSLMIQRLLLVALCVLGTAAAAQEVLVDGIKYRLDATAHTATVIPKARSANGLPVENQYTGDIVIPSVIVVNDNEEYTVTTIGNLAFYKCSGLNSIELPSTIKVIEDQAFYYCTAVTSINLPEGLETIKSGAFYGCTSLENLVIPNSVTLIERLMCSGCSSLQYIDFQSATPEIQMHQFSGNTADFHLTEFRVAEDNQKYSQIDGVLCNKAQTELILYPPAHGEHYTIPASISTIKKCSFMCCTLLKTVDIPNTVTVIEEEAFRESGLLSVIIPNSISVIEKLCFNNCPALQSVDLGSVTTLKQEAFSYCNALNSIEIPSTLISIGKFAFQNCGFTEIDIPSTVQDIGDYAFGHNIQLKTVKCVVPNESQGMFAECVNLESADLSNSAIIPQSCFDNCTQLNSVTLDNHLKTISKAAFYFCSNLKEISLPEGLEYIGVNAFALSGLESIEIPNTVTTIMQGAFSQCKSLESVQLPNQLEILPPMIFGQCELLESIEIPNSVKYFDDGTMGTQDEGGYAHAGLQFAGCVSLNSVILPNQLKNIAPSAFMGTAISEIEIPNSVEIIDQQAFMNSPLEQIELPFNLKHTPGDNAFWMTNLSYMKTYLQEPEVGSFMGGWLDDGTLYVPKDMTDIYFEIGDWYCFPNIVEATPVELEGEYTTFCSLDDLDFSEVEDLEAYVAVKQANGTLTMRRVRRVAAGTGVVLKGTPGFYEIPYADETETIGTNLLVGINDGARIPAIDGDKTNWLMDDEGDWAAADSSRLAFHHAYLQLPAGAEGVTEVKWVDNASYDLTGDGKVDVSDVNAVINIILKVKTASSYPGNPDVTGDGKIDVEDVNAIINIILKVG